MIPCHDRHFTLRWFVFFTTSLTVSLLGILPSTSSATLLSRPSVVRFGFYYNMVDSTYRSDGSQLYAGLKAAEKEINDADALDGTTISFDYIAAPPDSASDATRAQAAVNATSAFGGLFGFILSDWSNPAFIYAAAEGAANGTIPVVAPVTATNYEFSANYSFVAHLRLPPQSQTILFLQHALNNELTQCTAFTIVVSPQFAHMVADVPLAMQRFGYDPPVIITLNQTNSTANASAVLDAWVYPFASAQDAAQCGIFFTTSADVNAILGAMYGDTRFARTFPTMTFYSWIFGRKKTFNHTVYFTAPFSRLFFPSLYPDAKDSTVPVSVEYRTALAAYLATSPTFPSDFPAISVSVTQPNQRSLEGYFAGRYAGEILKGLSVITPARFIQSMYDRHFYSVGDVTLGPLTSRCVKDPFMPYPCFCNVGLVTTYAAQVNTTTGATEPCSDDDPVLHRSQSISPDVGECTTTAHNLKSPVHIAAFSPGYMPPVAAATFSRFVGVLRSGAEYYNNLGTYPGKYFSVSWMNRIAGMAPVDGTKNAESLRRLFSQRRPTVTIGSWFPSVSVPVFNLYLSPLPMYEELPVEAPTQYTRYTWHMKTPLADMIHTLAVYVEEHHRVAGRTPRIRILADTPTSYRLALASLHTVQLDPVASADVNFSDTSAVLAAVQAAVSASNGGEDTVLFAVAFDASAALTAVSAVVQAASLLHSGGEQRFALAIATDVTNMMAAKFTVRNVSALSSFPILFATALYPFWEPGSAPRATMAQYLGTNNSLILESPAIYSANTQMQVILMGMSSSTASVSATSILNTLYASGQIAVDGVVIGPVYDSNCSDDVIAQNRRDRKCQCFKAFRTLHVHDFRDWVHNSAVHNPQYSWTMSTCGVQYEPLVVPSHLNVALIAGVAAPIGTAAVCTMILAFCLCTGRNNRKAPKDPNAPFAMVFTDIQSSTSLWARAPEVMGEALEQHHEHLRRLVARHNGYEVKTIGDSFMVAFRAASDAASFALDIQTTLFNAVWSPDIDEVYIALAQEAEEERRMQEASESNTTTSKQPGGGNQIPQWEDDVNYPLNWNGIRVRVGMHWGVGSVKFDPVSQGYDYYGTLVNTAARVEGVGNGGQVLATKDFMTQLDEEHFPFADVELTPLGPQPLRGLDAPVPLYQLSPARLRTRQFNALRLDVENDVDDSASASETAHMSDGRSSQLQNETPEEYLERLLGRQREGAVLRPLVTRAMEFFSCMFRVTTTAWRKDTLSTLMKRWHVGHHKSGETRETKETADRQLALDMVGLCVRVVLAAEESKRQCTTRSDCGSSLQSGTSDGRNHVQKFIHRRSSVLSAATKLIAANQ